MITIVVRRKSEFVIDESRMKSDGKGESEPIDNILLLQEKQITGELSL